MLLYVHSNFAIVLMGKRELVAMISLCSWCLVIVVRLSLAVPWVCQQFVIVIFPDYTHLLFFTLKYKKKIKTVYKIAFPCASKGFCQHLCYHILHIVRKWLAGTRGSDIL